MKINFQFGLIALLLLAFTACEEKERAFPEFGDDNVATGAFARRIDGINGTFDFFDPENSVIDFTVEFYDLNQGRDVSEYNWTVSHISNSGGDNHGPVAIRSIPASSFTTSEFGFPSTRLEFSLSEALSTLGLTTDDIAGGDNIRFEATIVMNDGRTFSRANTGPNVISGAAFRGTFIVDQPIICPSELAGEYSLTTTGWCGGGYNGMAKFVSTGPGEYILQVDLDGAFEDDFSLGFYRACYGAGTAAPGGASGLRFQDACGKLSFNGLGSSPWGDGFILNSVVVDGATLTLDIETTWDPEAGTAVITRTDGTNWPPLR